MKIVECLPNISEGRRKELIDEVVAEARRFGSVKIVEIHMDGDHNRSVISIIGPPAEVVDAALALSLKAISLIDMRLHKGAHPRMGAVDAVPFAPVRGIDMAGTVAYAREFGRRLARAAGIPVYYYGEAATNPQRFDLPDIRRGEYESLEEKLKDPEWAPDDGPAVFNARTGATIVGARFPVIAFNVILSSANVAIAKKIAKAMRHKDGGFRYVKALGLELKERGQTQVSMNLTDYRKTPLPRVLEAIKAEARRYGATVVQSEFVGPVPLGTLEEVVSYYLQMPGFSAAQILESHIIEER